LRGNDRAGGVAILPSGAAKSKFFASNYLKFQKTAKNKFGEIWRLGRRAAELPATARNGNNPL
jgi:hypothetical protein